MSLQYGVPLEVLVNKFSHTRFEPMGHTTNPDIRIAKSMVDYIFRWMGITFLAGYREAATGQLKAEPVANIAAPAAQAASASGAAAKTKSSAKTAAKSESTAKRPKANGNGAEEVADECATSACYNGGVATIDAKSLERAAPFWLRAAAACEIRSLLASRATRRAAIIADRLLSATATAISATTAATRWDVASR